GKKFVLPVQLGAEGYAEFRDGGDIRVFDKQGKLLQTVHPTGGVPQLPAGPSRIKLDAPAGSAKLTLITLGDPLKL
ncbi:MAG: hypothetical protein NTY53_06390, partial [Kiritimatiellaeota bacterium]|nr:hypothetical protein [Kiritimatiellota bacterium]